MESNTINCSEVTSGLPREEQCRDVSDYAQDGNLQRAIAQAAGGADKHSEGHIPANVKRINRKGAKPCIRWTGRSVLGFTLLSFGPHALKASFF